MKTKKQQAQVARREQARRDFEERMRVENEEKRVFLATAPERLQEMLGQLPSQEVLAAIALKAAYEAYNAEVRLPQMEDTIEETEEDWVATWLHATLEEVVPRAEVTIQS